MRQSTLFSAALRRPARPALAPRPAVARWPVRGLLALGLVLTLGIHLPLALARLYDLGYDAPIHTFFADHYLRSWWDLWEPRWYTGFSVASYPPLAHQLMALIALALGHDAAYPGLLLLTLGALPLASYAFGRAFVAPRPAAYGALVAGLAPAVGLIAYPFGQLPSLLGTVLALGTLGALGSYLRDGATCTLVLTALLSGGTAAAHHLTYGVFLPLGGVAVAARFLLRPQGGRRTVLQRLPLGIAAGLAGGLTVVPFWLWLAEYVPQAPIDHPSRHNLLAEPDVQRLFLWPMYGVLPLLVLANLRDLAHRERLPLIALVVVLAVLGLGGTTPLPWLLFRDWASWLTYDRFSGWATLTALPFLGLTLVALLEGHHGLPGPARWGGLGLILAGLGASVVWAATLPRFSPVQPPPVDMAPLVRFLDGGGHARWRYLTLGFGDQMARLAYLTSAQSVDGSYHTARALPELRQSGIGQLDGALHWDPEGRVLLEVLSHAERYRLRWAFLRDGAYRPLLQRAGWEPLALLENGIAVWQRSGVPPLDGQDQIGAPRPPAWQGLLWGTVPLATLAAAGLLALGRSFRGNRRR